MIPTTISVVSPVMGQVGVLGLAKKTEKKQALSKGREEPVLEKLRKVKMG